MCPLLVIYLVGYGASVRNMLRDLEPAWAYLRQLEFEFGQLQPEPQLSF